MDGKVSMSALRRQVGKCCEGSRRRRAAKRMPWARNCVSAGACMYQPPAIESILLPCNAPTKLRCPQVESDVQLRPRASEETCEDHAASDCSISLFTYANRTQRECAMHDSA